MSFLNDKTFEGMDWLSQAVEPYHCRINDVLAKMPDEYVLTAPEVLNLITSSYQNNLDKSSVVRALYDHHCNEDRISLDYSERDILCKSFELAASGQVTIDAREVAMTGEIKLIKIANQVEEKEVIRLMQQAARLNINATDCHAETLYDVGTLFLEGSELMKEFNEAKSNKGRLRCIMTFVSQSVEKDTFKIRSVEAFKEFMKLISNFLSTKNPKDLGEIYRIVLMAKRGQVVYNVGAYHEKSK